MSSDSPPNEPPGKEIGNSGGRRSSITQFALFSPFYCGPSNDSTFGGPVNGPQRRRLSTTAIGLSGTSPTNPADFGRRRGSVSSNSDSSHDSAIGGHELSADTAESTSTAPFVRRMSLGQPPIPGYRPGRNPVNDQGTFNWPEQLKSRAESLAAGGRRSSFASPPPRGLLHHGRAQSVPDTGRTSAQTAPAKTAQEPRKPDAFQERILKGDFYMD
ncbi:hypothetical protein PCL_07275 [Purpureocillium lilacinum]|uniref:Uncharacterized protein n=1 Tax=Purpureocillium lilacinum TaxID=33203 RepID=A0A2U3DSL2_PURLI|nr:hypothetical protein PCL_07275 [Purpureocillium lilacinum]